MSIELRIPSAGESIQEVQIGQWLKREGDRVRRDESVVELDTDKASMELPAPSDGVLSRIVKHDGDKVAVGEVIGLIEPDGATAGKGDSKAATPTEAPAKPSGDVPSTAKSERANSPSPAPEASPSKSAPSKPAAAKPAPAEAVPHADVALPADE